MKIDEFNQIFNMDISGVSDLAIFQRGTSQEVSRREKIKINKYQYVSFLIKIFYPTKANALCFFTLMDMVNLQAGVTNINGQNIYANYITSLEYLKCRLHWKIHTTTKKNFS